MKKTIIVLIVLGACVLFYGNFFFQTPTAPATSVSIQEAGVEQ